MKLIAIADVHVSAKLPYAPRGYDRIEAETLPALYRVIRYASKNKIKHILMLGDFFDSISISPSEFRVLKLFVAAAAKHGIQLISIAGNHEIDESSTAIAHNMAGLDCKKRSFSLKIDGITICAIDFCRSLSEFKLPLTQLIKKTSPPRILIAHQAVEGAWFNKIKSINGIPKDWFSNKGIIGKNFAYCLFGDFHRSQPLPFNSGIYVGNLTQNDFKDEGNQPQFIVLDCKTMKTKAIASKAPTFNTMSITKDSIEFEKPRGKCYIRIKASGPKAFIRSLNIEAIRTELKEQYDAITIMIEPPTITDKHTSRTKAKTGIRKETSDEELVTTIIKKDQPPLIPTKILYDYGIKHLKAAREQQQ